MFHLSFCRGIHSIFKALAFVFLLSFGTNAFAEEYYSLTYQDPDGTIIYQTTTAEQGVEKQLPAKNGYIFTGWCESAEYTAATNTCSSKGRAGLETIEVMDKVEKTLVRWVIPGDVGNTTYIAMWEEDKFQITTTNISAGDYFGFALGAAGEFWVDWGDGDIEYITKDRVEYWGHGSNWIWGYNRYSHTYATSGVYTVRFGGLATGYKGHEDAGSSFYLGSSAIVFGYYYNLTGNSRNEGITVSFDDGTQVGKKIAGISGSLGKLFPTLPGYDTQNISKGLLAEVQPNFYSTFNGCTNLTGQIPSGLFNGITGRPTTGMFDATFSGCSGLTGTNELDPNNPGMNYAIPSTLFSGISGQPANSMFYQTFYGCSGLTGSIPAGLFGNLYGQPATNMFTSTFYGCGGLTGSIPAGLFGNLYGQLQYRMFYSTFSGCSGLTGSIPAGLFGNLYGQPAQYMFSGTFYGCSGLTGSIPAGLFGNLYGQPALYMFASTFSGCSGLTGPIPDRLFGNLTGQPAGRMFEGTFNGCTNLGKDSIGGASKYYVPSNLFGNINTNTTATAQMYNIFKGTGLLTGCPSGTTEYSTPFRQDWCAISGGCPTYTAGTTANYAISCRGSNTITYNNVPDYAINHNPDNYYSGGLPITLTDLSRDGYTFDGWCTDSALTNCSTNMQIPTGTTGNQEFWAKGTLTKYTITYNNVPSNVANNNPIFYAVSDLPITLNNLSRTGYTFDGWCDDSALTQNCSTNKEIPTGTTGDQIFYAKWTPINYNISYTLNGGTQASDQYTTYNGDMLPLTLKAPTRDGYIFAGWCKNASFTNCLTNNQIPVGTIGNQTFYAKWVESKFEITTTSDTDSFQFKISAAGVFYVDWGDGTVYLLRRTGDTTQTTYSHNYQSAGQRTIRFGGGGVYDATTNPDGVTAYSTADNTAAITFNITNNTNDTNIKKIAGISKSLGALFPTIGGAAATAGKDGSSDELRQIQPRFTATFWRATNLTGSIPENLFSGIEGQPAGNMFSSTFEECSGLTGTNIKDEVNSTENNDVYYAFPPALFGGLSGKPAWSMFSSTFYNCSGLTGSIPAGLFGNLSDAPAGYMFAETFSGCSGLTGSIPAGLFGNLSDAPANSMFYSTFSGCSGLTDSIPAGLFGNLSGKPAGSMFHATFNGCSGLTGSIPAGLFGNLSGKPADLMFTGTFRGCSNLTGPIPENLFGGIKGAPRYRMFWDTFNGCTNLGKDSIDGPSVYYIPPKLFAGIKTDTTVTEQMEDIFYGTGVLTSCPTDAPKTNQAITGFESDFDDRKACVDYEYLYCRRGTKYSAADKACVPCDESTETCPEFGNTYKCPDGYAGNADSTQCVVATYTITYNTNGGACSGGCSPTSYTIESSTITLPTPTKDGYIFAGWCTDSTLTNCSTNMQIPAGTTGTQEFWAKWTAINYTITYNLNGGTQASGHYTTYNVEQLPLTLKTPTRDGYIFIGWCTDAELTNCSTNMQIPAGTTGDQEFWAKWSVTATITWMLDGHAVTDGMTTEYVPGFTEWVSAGSKSITDKPDSIFIGWCLESESDAECSIHNVFRDAPVIPEGSIGRELPPDLTGSITLTARWVESKFQMTTTTETEDFSFDIDIGAVGDFWIDWGNGEITYYTGEGGTGSYYEIADKTHGESFTIKMGGLATGYNGYNAFNVSSYEYLASISGSLGAIFPTLSDKTENLSGESLNSVQPYFAGAFADCNNLTSIPEDLFGRVVNGEYQGVHGKMVESMFESTFVGCDSLTHIPENLFGRVVNGKYYGISGAAGWAFLCTFGACSEQSRGMKDLTSIPETLFGRVVNGKYYGVSGAAESMFDGTFMSTNITTIPENLFAGVTGNANGMFGYTFSYTNITTIPENLFKNIRGRSEYRDMFNSTFYGCHDLTSIPAKLFDGIDDRFDETFAGCSGLTEIPENLFSGVSVAEGFVNTFGRSYYWDPETDESIEYTCTGLTKLPNSLFPKLAGKIPEERMFESMFDGASGLSGYVPATLFGKLNSDVKYTMYRIFNGTNLATQCPSGTVESPTPFRQYWCTDSDNNCPEYMDGTTTDYAVSCIPNDMTLCGAGESLNSSTYECESCSGQIGCPTVPRVWCHNGGEYVESTGTCDSFVCTSKTTMEINDAPMCMIAGPVPSGEQGLTANRDGNVYHLKMSKNDTVIHTGSTHRIKIKTGTDTYYLHDASVGE